MQTVNNYHIPGAPKVVALPANGQAEYLGIAINAGSRNELPGEEGLAHFVEHTIFKGTATHRAWYILNRMEAVGGELNAYTTKEETFIYAVFPKGHMRRAADLITDLVASSVFPPSELDKEREVVADEINSYLDSPADSVYDDFEDIMFAGSPLGHNILGSIESVNRLTSADCRGWLERYYRPGRMVLFYSGAENADKIIAVAKRLSEHCATTTDTHLALPHRDPPTIHPRFNITRRIDTHQAHTVMGLHLPGMHSPERRAYSLVTNLLGGPGMNSLLNVELRERRGLVYSVEASDTFFTDCGLLQIYFGCDPADTARCMSLINRTLSRLATDGITQRRLQAAKRQYTGQLLLASENREQMVISAARAALHGLRFISATELIDSVNALTADDIAACCRNLSPDNISSLTLS